MALHLQCKACGQRIQPGQLAVQLLVIVRSKHADTTGPSEYIHYKHVMDVIS